MDIGCAKLISNGRSNKGKEITKVVEDGLIFEDGSKVEADLVVLATGYDNMRETARKILGDRLTINVRDVRGINSEGELSTIWQSTSVYLFFFTN